ncbi:hypothetical protein [Nodularia sphaerocarpa]|uniref:hypothetical protein n=1 Tax=Nodularia sphaerocarpa TaxID=137816 RepID=UPI001EFA6C40|nr:hypothetical protein [Nodularia sphaerocarpa]
MRFHDLTKLIAADDMAIPTSVVGAFCNMPHSRFIRPQMYTDVDALAACRRLHK